MKNVISTTLFAILSQESHQNLMWKVITSSNLNPPLKLYFYLPILANNNLLLKIYYENIVIPFLNCHFLFLYYFSFLNYIHTFLFFFSLGLFSTTHVSHSYISIYSSISFSSSFRTLSFIL